MPWYKHYHSINPQQFNAMHFNECKMHQNALHYVAFINCVTLLWSNLPGQFSHCSEWLLHCNEVVRGLDSGFVHTKACSTHSNWEKWPSRFGQSALTKFILKWHNKVYFDAFCLHGSALMWIGGMEAVVVFIPRHVPLRKIKKGGLSNQVWPE